tara:strand:+ start:561 stop:761 length:201 start_codon:yes stop_codon:yes gene_type:complete
MNSIFLTKLNYEAIMNCEATEIPKKLTNTTFTFECKLFDKNENTADKFPLEAYLVKENFVKVELNK